MEFFDSSNFMPHGHCYLWRPDILWLHVISDAIIGLAYASIPFALIYLVRKRKDLAFNWVFIMFGVFILACGATHFIEIYTVWNPIYGTAGIVKGITAAASLGTAIALWPLIPKVLLLPSPTQLARANEGLHLEIVERQKAELALEERNAALVEAERVKGEFLANVSHELRTPLTLILAPIESILSDATLSATQTQTLQTVHNNSIRLLQMVNSLLDFSKLDANKLDVKREPTEIIKLARTILADFEPIMATKNLHLSMETEVATPIVDVDRYLFERILFNLLSNAVKFTPEGGAVQVKVEQSDDKVRVAVRDTGVGIAPDDRRHLFEKFRQLEGSVIRRFEGTGLGLALVKEFTDLLGGSVNVESQINKGSIFTVEILAPPPHNQARSEELNRPYITGKSYHGTKFPSAASPVQVRTQVREDLPSVLIAEDNYELAYYISSVLFDLCTIRIAKDGEEAYHIAKGWKPDVVISDVMMPRRDGLSLCRDLKADPETKHIPVVLLTALTHREALLRGWEAGADEYLFKPFHPTELMTRMRMILVSVEERKKAEDDRKRYTNQLEIANKELDAFSYSVSHDLRAPLRAIDGFTKILMDEFTDSMAKEAQHYLNRVRDNSQQMGHLIDDLLAFSQMTRTDIRRSRINLLALIADSRDLFQSETKERDISWSIGPLPEVEGDPAMMRLVIQNLISNAIKYTRPRSQAKIEIGFTAQNDSYLFYVKDNGVGFDMRYQEKLFAIFQRLHSSEEFEGTGIGLANVLRIITRHGGKVWAESEVEKGSTFYFSLPHDHQRPVFRV